MFLYVRTYVCMYGCMYVCVCMYVCMHVCMYVCMYVCMLHPISFLDVFFLASTLLLLSQPILHEPHPHTCVHSASQCVRIATSAQSSGKFTLLIESMLTSPESQPSNSGPHNTSMHSILPFSSFHQLLLVLSPLFALSYLCFFSSFFLRFSSPLDTYSTEMDIGSSLIPTRFYLFSCCSGHLLERSGGGVSVGEEGGAVHTSLAHMPWACLVHTIPSHPLSSDPACLLFPLSPSASTSASFWCAVALLLCLLIRIIPVNLRSWFINRHVLFLTCSSIVLAK
jgi:hypothetical protein